MTNSNQSGNGGRLHTSTAVILGCSVFIFAVLLMLCYTSAWAKYEQLWEAQSSTDVFKDIDALQFDEGSFTKEDLGKAKITAFNVWETTCPACLSEMGDLEKLSNYYPADEFRLVGICADVYDRNGELKPEQIAKGKELMADAGTTFTNIIPSTDMHTFIRASVAGYPTTFFVDSEGNIIATTTGSRGFDDWVAKVDEVMEGR